MNEKFPHTLDYVTLKERAAAGVYGNMYLDGPMDVKTACDAHSGEVKGISSPVVGHADLLIFPNIESGNTFYKTVSLFGDANMAGMLRGTTSPVVFLRVPIPVIRNIIVWHWPAWPDKTFKL